MSPTASRTDANVHLQLLLSKSIRWSAEFRGVREVINVPTIYGHTPLDLAVRCELGVTQNIPHENNYGAECDSASPVQSTSRDGSVNDSRNFPLFSTVGVKTAALTIQWLCEHGARTSSVDLSAVRTLNQHQQRLKDRQMALLRSRRIRLQTRQSVERSIQQNIFLQPRTTRRKYYNSTSVSGAASAPDPRQNQRIAPLANPNSGTPYRRLMDALSTVNLNKTRNPDGVGNATGMSMTYHHEQDLITTRKAAVLRRQLGVKNSIEANRPQRASTPSRYNDRLPTSAADILARVRATTPRRNQSGLHHARAKVARGTANYSDAWRALWRILVAMQVYLDLFPQSFEFILTSRARDVLSRNIFPIGVCLVSPGLHSLKCY